MLKVNWNDEHFKFDKEISTKNTFQEWYEAGADYNAKNLSGEVEDALMLPGVSGVQICEKIYSKELDQEITVSKYFDFDTLDYIEEEYNGDVEAYMNEEIFGLTRYEGYKATGYQMRIIYTNK